MHRYLFWLVLTPLVLGGVCLSLSAPSLSGLIQPWLSPGSAEGSSQQTKSPDAAIADLRTDVQTFKNWVLAQALNMLGILLGVIGVVLAVIGLVGKAWAQSFIDEKIKESRDELLYLDDIKQAVDIYETEPDQAIAFTQRALKSGLLKPSVAVLAKTNLAYFYACRKNKSDAQEALRLAKEAIEEGIHVLRHRLVQLLIHEGYVRLQFAEPGTPTDEARKLLEAIKKHKECTAELQKEIDSYLTPTPKAGTP
jgi:hypothetical protein